MKVTRDGVIGACVGAVIAGGMGLIALLASGCGRSEPAKGQTEVRFVMPGYPESHQPTSVDRDEVRRLDELNRRQDQALSK